MHKVVKKLWLPSSPAILSGAAAGGGGPATLYTASPALNADDANTGYCFRVVCPVGANSLTQLRATLRPGSVNSLSILHASFGKWDAAEAAYANTTTAPIELKFATASGFTGATSPKTSDWASITGFSLAPGDKVVIIYDVASGGASVASQRLNNASIGVTTFFQSGAFWNVADTIGAGFSDLANTNYCVDAVETQ